MSDADTAPDPKPKQGKTRQNYTDLVDPGVQEPFVLRYNIIAEIEVGPGWSSVVLVNKTRDESVPSRLYPFLIQG